MTYKIADTVFSLNTVHKYPHVQLADYLCEEVPELEIETTGDDIASARELFGEEGSDGYIEFLAVLGKLSDRLLCKDTLLFHGSALSVDGRCYIFGAPSGTGKSTHSRLWRELLGDRVVMVNDDKPFIRIGDLCTVFGSPWDGKERLSTNTSVPLKAVCIIERSEENSIEALDPRDAVPLLMAQAYREGAADRVLFLVTALADRVPTYRLRCNISEEAARLSWETMSGAALEEKGMPDGSPVTFEEELKKHGFFIFPNKGDSMRPLIRPGRDVPEISALGDRRPEKYDVVLYKAAGNYILHRIIRIRHTEHGTEYSALGDHNLHMEHGIRDDQVIGILSGIVRNGTVRTDLCSFKYRLYVLLWCRLYPLRIAAQYIINIAGSLCRKIFRRTDRRG